MVFVMDTNTLVSGILNPQGIPAQAMFAAQVAGCLYFSDETKQEFISVIQRPKFNKYASLPDRLEKANKILSTAKFAFVETKRDIECRDVTDIKFLELAVEASADCLISGDPDLLTLHPFRGIPIINAATFLSSF